MKKLKTYIWGFVLSIALTVAAFGAALQGYDFAVPFLVLCAIVQLIIQLMLFLHLGEEPSPRWNLQAFVFAVLVVFIVVGGTLWIMYELSHMQMNPGENYNVFEEENIFPNE